MTLDEVMLQRENTKHSKWALVRRETSVWFSNTISRRARFQVWSSVFVHKGSFIANSARGLGQIYMSRKYIRYFQTSEEYSTASTMLPTPKCLLPTLLSCFFNVNNYDHKISLPSRTLLGVRYASSHLCYASVPLCSCRFCAIVDISVSVWEGGRSPDLTSKTVLREFKQAAQI